jgi:hypothetical protein
VRRRWFGKEPASASLMPGLEACLQLVLFDPLLGNSEAIACGDIADWSVPKFFPCERRQAHCKTMRNDAMRSRPWVMESKQEAWPAAANIERSCSSDRLPVALLSVQAPADWRCCGPVVITGCRIQQWPNGRDPGDVGWTESALARVVPTSLGPRKPWWRWCTIPASARVVCTVSLVMRSDTRKKKTPDRLPCRGFCFRAWQ